MSRILPGEPVGVYRLWRDGGFAVGALLAGGIADVFGLKDAIDHIPTKLGFRTRTQLAAWAHEEGPLAGQEHT